MESGGGRAADQMLDAQARPAVATKGVAVGGGDEIDLDAAPRILVGHVEADCVTPSARARDAELQVLAADHPRLGGGEAPDAEERLAVASTKGGQPRQLLGQAQRDLGQIHLPIDHEGGPVAPAHPSSHLVGKSRSKAVELLGTKADPCRGGVTSVAFELELPRADRQDLMQMDAPGGPGRTTSDGSVEADHDHGFCEAIDETSRDDPDHAVVPPLLTHDDGRSVAPLDRGGQCLDPDLLLDALSFAIDLVELAG